MNSAVFSKIFLFIYKAPWSVALLAPLVALLLRGADAFLRPRTVRGRRVYLLLFLLWLPTVAAFTLLFREGPFTATAAAEPFASLKKFLSGRNPETLRSFWMNVLLFIPGGMFFTGMLSADNPDRPFRSALFRALAAFLMGTVLSAAVEGTQIAFNLGRYETDDIIANSFGTLLGTVPELGAGLIAAFLGWETENRLWKPLVSLANRHWHIISYIFWGGTTTLVNWLVFFPLKDKIHYLLANLAAWVVSVLFAFVVQRTFVFRSAARGFGILLEGVLFAAHRALSFVLEEFVLLPLGIEVLHVDSTVTKVVVAIIIAVVNYLVEKLLIFRKKREPEFEDF